MKSIIKTIVLTIIMSILILFLYFILSLIKIEKELEIEFQPEEPKYKQILIDVMNNKQKYYDNCGNYVNFSDEQCGWYEGNTMPENFLEGAQSYTFVDLDKDGFEELCVLANTNYGFYILFRFNPINEQVYGYVKVYRGFLSVKKDGTYHGSNGVAGAYFIKANFVNNKMVEEYIAIHDEVSEKYEIGNVLVKPNESKEFMEEWVKRENCDWETKEIIKENQ